MVLNIQTERIENHRARFTVEVENSKLEDAKKQAAREISRRYNIPGFRRGKAPYRILVNYIGEGPILENAVEKLGNDVYKDAVDNSELRPYGPGELEDFKLDPQPTFIFTFPLEPEVSLSEYRAMRMDYEVPVIDDEAVDKALNSLLDDHSLTEETDQPVAHGNRVTVDLHSEFVDGDERPENDGDEEDDDDEAVIYKGDSFLHRHGAKLRVGIDTQAVLPGFGEMLMGASVGDNVEFELTVPDEEPYDEIKGRQVKFTVDITLVETVTVPELNDEFAGLVAEEVGIAADEDNPATVDRLRAQLRDDLQTKAEASAKAEFVEKMIDEITTQSEVSYPDLMVEERLDDMVEERDQFLRNYGMSLETFMQITNRPIEDIRNEMREDATHSVMRTLVLRQLLADEEVRVPTVRVDEKIDSLVSQFGDQADAFRAYFDNAETRQNIAGNLLYESLMDRLFRIGRGEALDDVVPEETETDSADADEAEETPAASDETNASEQ
jgi:trigger factor